MTKVLDHGSVELVDHWGSEEGIIEAARMSTGKGFLGWGPLRFCSFCMATAEQLGPVDMWQHCAEHENGSLFHEMEEKPGDEKLLAYLWKNKHTTPFEMAGATFEVKAPIFVFREWHRHRTQSYNEMSARYTPLPNENYVPTVERCFGSDTKNRQAQAYSMTELSKSDVDIWRTELDIFYTQAEALYQRGLKIGIPKELARLPVPVARYSRMRASTDLLNWTKFLRLRCAPNAQYEIRVYANAIREELARLFPRTLSLFDEGTK